MENSSERVIWPYAVIGLAVLGVIVGGGFVFLKGDFREQIAEDLIAETGSKTENTSSNIVQNSDNRNTYTFAETYNLDTFILTFSVPRTFSVIRKPYNASRSTSLVLLSEKELETAHPNEGQSLSFNFVRIRPDAYNLETKECVWPDDIPNSDASVHDKKMSRLNGLTVCSSSFWGSRSFYVVPDGSIYALSFNSNFIDIRGVSWLEDEFLMDIVRSIEFRIVERDDGSRG